ncbi:MAG: hypothetical protein GDA36_08430 [Rhodobacteraceae bacterium]|nr:hypothetical protein [Paracoccaceae bacterium]
MARIRERKEHSDRRIPIIAVATFEPDGDKKSIPVAGADDCLTKPGCYGSG